jgi:hypothetical protein
MAIATIGSCRTNKPKIGVGSSSLRELLVKRFSNNVAEFQINQKYYKCGLGGEKLYRINLQCWWFVYVAR